MKIVTDSVLEAAREDGYPIRDRYMHHILLHDEGEFDQEITGWIEMAWAMVGPGRR